MDLIWVERFRQYFFRAYLRVAPQLLTTSNFIGPWYHAALLFSGLGSIVLLFGVLFSQQIREDLVRAATSPGVPPGPHFHVKQSHKFRLRTQYFYADEKVFL